jgi:hypothetical protein
MLKLVLYLQSYKANYFYRAMFYPPQAHLDVTSSKNLLTAYVDNCPPGPRKLKSNPCVAQGNFNQ